MWKELLQTIEVKCDGWVAEILLNRASKSNAFNAQMWKDFAEAFGILRAHADVRAVLITASGKNFCAGIDLAYFSSQFGSSASASSGCPARARYAARTDILHMQEAFNSIEAFPWPVVVAIHGACVGAGVDLITACDIRFAASDATFSVKEVDVGITADLGTLQRLPHIVGYGAACDLCLTGRTVNSSDAQAMGLVSAVFANNNALLDAARKVVQGLARKSPLAVVGTKRVLQHAREHTVKEGLEYVATWNSAMLIQSSDAQEAVKAAQQRRKPMFSRL